jgi:hypothetical protein
MSGKNSKYKQNIVMCKCGFVTIEVIDKEKHISIFNGNK